MNIKTAKLFLNSLLEDTAQINLIKPVIANNNVKPILKPSAVLIWSIKYNKPVESIMLKSAKSILWVA